MAYVSVDVDLDEFETNELVEELVRRLKSFIRRHPTDKEKDELRQELQPLLVELNISPLPDLKIKTLDDKMKFDYLVSVWDKYTSFQFEALLQ